MMKEQVSLRQKFIEVTNTCSRPAQRFGMLVWSTSMSSTKPEDLDEFLRVVLDFSQEQLDDARDEFVAAMALWSMAHGAAEQL